MKKSKTKVVFGDKFGSFEYVYRVFNADYPYHHYAALECQCGETVVRLLSDVKRKSIADPAYSCGCLSTPYVNYSVNICPVLARGFLSVKSGEVFVVKKD